MKQIVIDTDIGGDIDDAYALVFLLNSKKIDIKAIIAAGDSGESRAKIAYEIIQAANKEIPIFQGVKIDKGTLTEMKIPETSKFKPQKLEENLQFFRELFKNKIYYLSIGPLSNLFFLMENIPEMTDNTEVLIMGGSIDKNYNGENKRIPEWNIKADVRSSKYVFNSKTKLSLVPLDVTWDIELSEQNLAKIRERNSPLTQVLDTLYLSWSNFLKNNLNLIKKPILFDPFTAALLVDESLAEFKEVALSVTKTGEIMKDKRGKIIRIATASNKNQFLVEFMNQILS